MQSGYRARRSSAPGHPLDVADYIGWLTPLAARRSHNGQVSEETPPAARGLLRQGLAALRWAEPVSRPSRRALITDSGLAVAVLALSVAAAAVSYSAGHLRQVVVNPLTGQVFMSLQTSGATIAGIAWQAVAAAVLTSVPLAFRRLYPLGSFLVLLAAMFTARLYATDVTFLALVFAAYSVMAHSRFRGAALATVPIAGLVMTGAFWRVMPAGQDSPMGVRPGPLVDGRLALTWSNPWRGVALLALVSMVLIAVIGNAVHAREARARVLAEHEAATRRAVEQERARIASELHDVVTHNVSVMIVQAGAARQVLAETPGQARAALLAVESSGRAAMTELRHLLGLLSPSPAAYDADEGQDLRPQPGLAQLQPLVDRVAAAGLPVELEVGDIPAELPPGLDLAAFRVVQEGLTNVLRHAGKPRTSIRVGCRDGSLVVEVADAGRPVPAAGPAPSGGGRGLLGLRERAVLYGGQLDAGPVPGGGWLVRARLPVDPAVSGPAVSGPAVSGRDGDDVLDGVAAGEDGEDGEDGEGLARLARLGSDERA
jgi:signal transduction histidine kinase